MNAIKMNRTELLEIVRTNRDKHITDAVEAVADYKALVIKIATDNLELANTGDLTKLKDIKSLPGQPCSYEQSYTRAIRMLELSVEDIIEIEEDVFNQLVLDEWTWKNSFSASNTLYKSGF